MNYLRSERLKFKRTISNKLLIIIPLITVMFAWIAGGFTRFQCFALYWWYAFLLPGAIAILCFLSHRKEEAAGKYYSVFSMPVDLVKFEGAKGLILVEKLLAAAVVLALLISVSHVIAPATAVYSVAQSLVGSVGVILASVWQIPLCLFLARKTGLFFPVFLNTILGVFLPIALGNTAVWWLAPYCCAAKLSESLMGIGINGTFLEHYGFSVNVPIAIALSVFLFVVLSYADARDFSARR